MGRILALDIGDVRIGIAVSDPMQIIANPLQTYKRIGMSQDIEYLCDLAKQQQVTLLVSGLPVSMNGEENSQTQKTREFAQKLSEKSGINLKYVDERLTTVSAEKALIEGGMRRENRKGVIDKVAATIILQNYLDYYNK